MQDHSNICQDRLPVIPWRDPALARLPGIKPLAPGEWLVIDEVFDRQMAYRDHLIATRREAVFGEMPQSLSAAEELLRRICAELQAVPGYEVTAGLVTRPDGVAVAPDSDHPLLIAGRLVQEDLCILQRKGAEHVLTAGLLCFPSSWTLSEKLGRPLVSIHRPVERYGDDVARRVQRLFDLMQPDRPLWRANTLVYADPELHQPRPETAPRRLHGPGPRWLRSERQCLVKLPETGAVVFSIHNWVVPFERLDPQDLAALPAHLVEDAL